MGLYDVIEPCAFAAADGRVVHYTRPGTKPVEIDDAVAGPLVEAGLLYPRGVPGPTGTPLDVDPSSLVESAAGADSTSPEPDPEPDASAPKARGRREAG